MFKRLAIIHSLVSSRELHFRWIYSEGSGLHKGEGLLCLSRRSSSIGELSPLSFAIKYFGGQTLISVFYKRRLTKAFEALWLALVILSSGKSRYPEVMFWVKINTNNVHSFKGMSDKKNNFGNQIWFSLPRALCEWSSRFKWPSLVDVSATTGLTIWQWKEIMGGLGEIGDKDRDEGNDSNDFRPGGLEEIAQGRGRCPQCAVLVRWQILFFLTVQHPIFKLLVINNLASQLVDFQID